MTSTWETIPGEFVSNKLLNQLGKTSIESESDSISLPGRLKSPHKMIGCESGMEDKDW